MAVRIEQPQPFAAEVSRAYGASTVMPEGTREIANAYDRAARQRIATSEAAADRRQRSQLAGLEFAQRQTQSDYENLQRANIAQGQYQSDLNRLDVEREGIQATLARQQMAGVQAQNEIVARGQVQQMLMGQALTNEEQQRKTRLQNFLSMAAHDPSMDDVMRRDLMTQIMTDLSPLQQRERAAQVQLREQQAQMLVQESQMRTKAVNAGAELEKRMKEQGVGVLNLGVHPDTLMPRLLFQNPKDGTWYEPFDSAGGRGAGGSGGEQKIGTDLAVKVDAAMQKELAEAAKSEGATAMPGWSGSREARQAEFYDRLNMLRGAAGLPPVQPPQAQPGVGAAAFKSANPMDWGEGFDLNNPPPGQPAQYVANVRQKIDSLQADPTISQHRKTDYQQARRRMLEIAAKPNKTAEDRADFERLGQVERPGPDSQAQRQADLVEAIIQNHQRLGRPIDRASAERQAAVLARQ